jgi:hypothetical protein
MPEESITKMTDLQETEFLHIWFDKCALLVFIHPNELSVSLCRAASALCSSDMTYIPLFYVVIPDISDYANILICPSGMMPSM